MMGMHNLQTSVTNVQDTQRQAMPPTQRKHRHTRHSKVVVEPVLASRSQFVMFLHLAQACVWADGFHTSVSLLSTARLPLQDTVLPLPQRCRAQDLAWLEWQPQLWAVLQWVP
jgi:hypothetical protein